MSKENSDNVAIITSMVIKKIFFVREETSLAVQWLRLGSSSAGDLGLIPGQGTKIPHAAWPRKIFVFN